LSKFILIKNKERIKEKEEEKEEEEEEEKERENKTVARDSLLNELNSIYRIHNAHVYMMIYIKRLKWLKSKLIKTRLATLIKKNRVALRCSLLLIKVLFHLFIHSIDNWLCLFLILYDSNRT
jgi:hypothetical protein